MEGEALPAYRLENYRYDLPEELIAQVPSQGRGTSRMLVLDRASGHLEHHLFEDVSNYIQEGDVLVLNDTRVVPARVWATKETGGRAEILVLDPYTPWELGQRDGYRCLVRASKRPKQGSRLSLTNGIQVEMLTPVEHGKAKVRFLSSKPLLSLLDEIGEVPLPPYILRDDGPAAVDDASRYQTVYARHSGAVAAPTAGLHFSETILEGLRAKGVEIARVTLHVGYGTFSPIRVSDIRNHSMHEEHAEIGSDAVERILKARREGRRVVAVGTTVVRVLEWVAAERGALAPFAGACRHYIYPGYRFQVVDALLTNFHLPESSLLLLVSAFATREAILKAYSEAVAKRYRFFSYGDAMLIL